MIVKRTTIGKAAPKKPERDVNYLKFTPDTELLGRRSCQRAGASGQAIFMASFLETTGKIRQFYHKNSTLP